MSALTERDRVTIDRARVLTGFKTPAAVRNYARETATDDTSTLMAFIGAFASAQAAITELIALAERLAGEDGSEEGKQV